MRQTALQPKRSEALLPVRTLGDIERWPWATARYDAIAAIFIQFLPPERREGVIAAMKCSPSIFVIKMDLLSHGIWRPQKMVKHYHKIAS